MVLDEIERDEKVSVADQPRTVPEAWPSAAAGRGLFTPNLSLVVGRALGTVVVTVAGELDLDSCELLESLLTDLIEGQGNLAVAVDLTRATIEPEAVSLLVEAASRAGLHGMKLVLKALPDDAHDALRSGGLSELVEVIPGRGSR